jgi:hypothetical protein
MTKQAYKGIIKGIILAIIAIIVFISTPVAFGSTLYSQEIKNSDNTAYSSSQRQWQKLGNGLSGRINSFILYMDNSGSTNVITKAEISIKGFTNSAYTTASTTSNCGLGDTASSLWGTNDNITATTTEDITELNTAGYFLFSRFAIKPNGCLLDSSLYYAFSISYTGSNPNGSKMGGSVANTWSSSSNNYLKGAFTGDPACSSSYPNCSTDANISDLYFVAGYNLIPITNALISIVKPANLSTNDTGIGLDENGFYNIGNFNEYLFPPFIDIKLTYHDTSTGSDLWTMLDWNTFEASTTTAGLISWSRFLPFNPANATIASSTYYQIVAKILSNPYRITLATATSTFYVNIAGSKIPQPYVYIGGSGTIVSTTTGQILNGCNSKDINILQAVLCWLFVPRIEKISQFGLLKTQIIDKPPVGYLSAISNIITATTSTSTPIDDLIIPTGSASPFTILRTALTWLLWFIFGIFIFNRLRYLDLW